MIILGLNTYIISFIPLSFTPFKFSMFKISLFILKKHYWPVFLFDLHFSMKFLLLHWIIKFYFFSGGCVYNLYPTDLIIYVFLVVSKILSGLFFPWILSFCHLPVYVCFYYLRLLLVQEKQTKYGKQFLYSWNFVDKFVLVV